MRHGRRHAGARAPPGARRPGRRSDRPHRAARRRQDGAGQGLRGRSWRARDGRQSVVHVDGRVPRSAAALPPRPLPPRWRRRRLRGRPARRAGGRGRDPHRVGRPTGGRRRPRPPRGPHRRRPRRGPDHRGHRRDRRPGALRGRGRRPGGIRGPAANPLAQRGCRRPADGRAADVRPLPGHRHRDQPRHARARVARRRLAGGRGHLARRSRARGDPPAAPPGAARGGRRRAGRHRRHRRRHRARRLHRPPRRPGDRQDPGPWPAAPDRRHRDRCGPGGGERRDRGPDRLPARRPARSLPRPGTGRRHRRAAPGARRLRGLAGGAGAPIGHRASRSTSTIPPSRPTPVAVARSPSTGSLGRSCASAPRPSPTGGPTTCWPSCPPTSRCRAASPRLPKERHGRPTSAEARHRGHAGRGHPGRPCRRASQLPRALAGLRLPPGARDQPAGTLPGRSRRVARWSPTAASG